MHRARSAAAKAAKPYIFPLTKTVLETILYLNSIAQAPCISQVIAVALQAIKAVEVRN